MVTGPAALNQRSFDTAVGSLMVTPRKSMSYRGFRQSGGRRHNIAFHPGTIPNKLFLTSTNQSPAQSAEPRKDTSMHSAPNTDTGSGQPARPWRKPVPDDGRRGYRISAPSPPCPRITNPSGCSATSPPNRFNSSASVRKRSLLCSNSCASRITVSPWAKRTSTASTGISSTRRGMSVWSIVVPCRS